MKLKDIINQLANRINQPHVIEVYLRQVYAKGFVNGTKKSPWISVKERLPEEGDPVLIRLKDGVVRLACYDIDDIEEDSNIYFWNDNYSNETIRACDVTHWCYIPYFDNNYKLSKE